MNTSEIKKLVTKFRREFGIRDVTAESLEGAFRKQGFTIIDFNPAVNDPDVTTVIDSLGFYNVNDLVYMMRAV